MSERLWYALRQTAYVCAFAVGLGIGLAMCSGCAPTTWTYAARASEGLAVSSLACDGGQTHQFLAESDWIETNPVLGKHPSDAALFLYLGSIAAGVIGLNRIIPPKVALALNLAVFAVEAQSVYVNSSVGASMCGVGHGGPWAPMDEIRSR